MNRQRGLIRDSLVSIENCIRESESTVVKGFSQAVADAKQPIARDEILEKQELEYLKTGSCLEFVTLLRKLGILSVRGYR